jgi:hypothetical protein
MFTDLSLQPPALTVDPFPAVPLIFMEIEPANIGSGSNDPDLEGIFSLLLFS